KERITRIKRLAKTTSSGTGVMWDDPDFRQRLAEIEIEVKALEITQMRVIANQMRNGSNAPDPASSILKIKGSELQQATTEILLELTGPYGAPSSVGNADYKGEYGWADAIAPSYFNNRKVSIYGGSNEIQHNVIAKAILGL